jgi:hypothetical protein
MFTVSFTLRNAMMAAAMWLRATKLRSSFSYRTSSLRKRLNQLWQTSTTQRLALLVDRAPEVVSTTVDLHETLVEVPAGQGAQRLDPLATDLGSKCRN